MLSSVRVIGYTHVEYMHTFKKYCCETHTIIQFHDNNLTAASII